jgi:hypothetical protein
MMMHVLQNRGHKALKVIEGHIVFIKIKETESVL